MPKAIENAKDAILSTARSLLLQEGYEALNMRSIASVSGIGTGTVYNYFKAKDEIVVALMTEDWFTALAEMDLAIDKKLQSGIATEHDKIIALEYVFLGLKNFVQNYRPIWVSMASVPESEKSSTVRHYNNCLFMNDMSLRIAKIFGLQYKDDTDFTLSFVCKSLSMYAQETNVDFNKLGKILIQVMNSAE